MNSYFLCGVCVMISVVFFQKNKHEKDLRHKGLPNEEICREIFASNTATSHMAYESGSVVPPRSNGIVGEDIDGPLYDDISIGEHVEDDHVSHS